MNFAETCNRIFWNTTQYYHRFDQVDAPLENPYSEGKELSTIIHHTSRHGIR